MQVRTPRTTRTVRALRTLALVTTLGLTAAACGSDGAQGSNASAPADTTAPVGTTGGSDATDTTAVTETTVGEAPAIDTLTLESGFSTGVTSVGTPATSAAAIVTNTSDVTACNVEVTFSLLDASGAQVDGRTETIAVVPAGAAVPIAPKFQRATDTPPASLEAAVSAAEFATGTTCEPSATSLGVAIATADVAIDADRKYVRGTLTNDSESDAATTEVQCALRDASGAIVGGDSTTVREVLAAGATGEFKVRVIWAPDTAVAADCAASA